MTPLWTNGLAALYQADAREIPLPDESVHCVVTSPPYWGQRDYNIQGGIGLEDSLGEWTESLVGVFREVGRVLRNDGTLWLNVGDGYTGSGKGSWAGGRSHGEKQRTSKGSLNSPVIRGKRVPRGKGISRWGMGDVAVDGLDPKNLMGLPWRLAFALQDDGWWLRSEIIWHKPNPMPGSQKDRPTSSHETIFLLSKRERYFYDSEAVKGKYAQSTLVDKRDNSNGQRKYRGYPGAPSNGGTNLGGGKGSGPMLHDVWTFPPQGRKHAHEAAFPDELPRRCILLGTPAWGICAECGAPWRRIVEKTFHPQEGKSDARNIRGAPGQKPRAANNNYDGWPRGSTTTVSVGWEPVCRCGADSTPATVLDPFVGSGTTCAVAQQLGRRSVGIDLSEDYLLNIARPRLEGIALPMDLGV